MRPALAAGPFRASRRPAVAVRAFKDGYKVLIIGGGSGGATVASHYARKLPGQVAVIEVRETHARARAPLLLQTCKCKHRAAVTAGLRSQGDATFVVASSNTGAWHGACPALFPRARPGTRAK